MTDQEALDDLIQAAEAVADWYRTDGNPLTPRYAQLVNALAHTVEVWRTVQTKKVEALPW